MSSYLKFVFACSTLSLPTFAWPAASDINAATLPTLELSVAPPSMPVARASAVVGNLDRSRESYETIMMGNLKIAQDAAKIRAKDKIGSIVGRAMKIFDDPAVLKALSSSTAFLASTGKGTKAQGKLAFAEKISVKVNVGKAATESVDTGPIETLERGSAASEKSLFEQATLEMNGIVDAVAAEFEAQLQSQINAIAAPVSLREVVRQTSGGFLAKTVRRALPDQANVRVVSPDLPYPTAGSMVQDMLKRRDTAENLATIKIDIMKLELLKSINAAIEDSLGSSIRRVVAQSNALM